MVLGSGKFLIRSEMINLKQVQTFVIILFVYNYSVGVKVGQSEMLM